MTLTDIQRIVELSGEAARKVGDVEYEVVGILEGTSGTEGYYPYRDQLEKLAKAKAILNDVFCWFALRETGKRD